MPSNHESDGRREREAVQRAQGQLSQGAQSTRGIPNWWKAPWSVGNRRPSRGTGESGSRPSRACEGRSPAHRALRSGDPGARAMSRGGEPVRGPFARTCPGPRGAGESRAWRRLVTVTGMPMAKRTQRPRSLVRTRVEGSWGVPACLCVLQKSSDGTWLREAKNRSLLTEHRFAQTEPSNEKRFRFANGNRESALRAKTCREPRSGGKVAAPRKGWFSRANGRKRPPARHEEPVIWRWKASRTVDTALLSRGGRSRRSWRGSIFTGTCASSAGKRRAARQGCQRLGPRASVGKENVPKLGSRGPAEAVCGVVKRRVPRTRARREPCDESGTHEARVLVVESVGKQMSVRRIARPFRR